MIVSIQNIDETLKALWKLQEDTEKAVKEAGDALRIYIEKSAIIHSNRQQVTAMKLPITVKNGIATPLVQTPYIQASISKASNRPGKKGNSNNEMSLKETIKVVLARSSKGMKVGEIVDVIENEKLWQTKNGKVESQVPSNLSAMKEKGLIARNEDGSYCLVSKIV